MLGRPDVLHNFLRPFRTLEVSGRHEDDESYFGVNAATFKGFRVFNSVEHLFSLHHEVLLAQVQSTASRLQDLVSHLNILNISGDLRIVMLVQLLDSLVGSCNHSVEPKARHKMVYSTRIHSVLGVVCSMQVRGELSFFVSLVNHVSHGHNSALRANDCTLVLLSHQCVGFAALHALAFFHV